VDEQPRFGGAVCVLDAYDRRVEELGALVGEWDVSAIVDGQAMSVTRQTFELIENGSFLVHRSEVERLDDLWKGAAPEWTRAVIGRDDRSARYGYLYADARGVRRVYEMSFEDDLWRIWGRAGEAFFQRFVGRLSDDGNAIAARWERSADAETWDLDFELAYARVR
jgi:hypothetical protein